jgi:hypothetical protein
MLAGTASANATVTDLGNVNPAIPTSFTGSVLSPGPFNDIFSFILPPNTGSGYSVLNFPLSIPEVENFNTIISSISLYSNTDGILFNGDDTNVASFLVPGGNTIGFTWEPSLGGSMYMSISGIANGSLGGLYSGSISVSAIPEPESYAMLLAGLGIIGAIIRRRSLV